MQINRFDLMHNLKSSIFQNYKKLKANVGALLVLIDLGAFTFMA